MPKCCGGRGDAHYGWCAKVGGPGKRPTSPTQRLQAVGEKLAEPRRRRTQPGAALTHLVGSHVPRPTGLTVLHAVRTPEEERQRNEAARMRWSTYAGEVDWSKVEVEASVHDLWDMCKRGLPPAISFGYLPEVLEMYGVDFDMVESIIRSPQRVEIRPEYKTKRYPVLAFHRGDVMVVLGMRIPTKPWIIAIYVSPLLEHDTHRVGGTGGGGSRRSQGLPATLRASIRTLTMLGAEIPEDWETATDRAMPVMYKGADLGKIQVGHVEKRQVQSDYQRVLRKMHAIDRRQSG